MCWMRVRWAPFGGKAEVGWLLWQALVTPAGQNWAQVTAGLPRIAHSAAFSWSAGGLEQLLARADPAQPEQLQEAAVDGLCKLAANHPPAKDAAAAAGAIPRLAALLGVSGSGSVPAEVTVRALLALGMLAGGSPERQLELAGQPGAVAALLRLMRQQDDADMQQIAAGGLWYRGLF